MLQKIKFLSKTIYLLTMIYLLIYVITCFVFVGQTFNQINFYPSEYNLSPFYKIIFFGFNAAPYWIHSWFENPEAANSNPTNYSVVPFLMFGILFGLVFLFGITCFIREYNFIYLIIIAIFVFFFLPYGYLFGTIFFANSIIIILVSSQFQRYRTPQKKLVSMNLEKVINEIKK